MADAANRTFFQRLLRIVSWLIENSFEIDKIQTGELKFMYIVKDDNPDVGYTVDLGDVTDAEGNVIPDEQVDVAVESDNSDAVSVSPAADDPNSGIISFGAPGAATITVSATDRNSGKLLATGSASFTVTTGDPAAISGLDISFDGLTEV
jgi:hypothetical protein